MAGVNTPVIDDVMNWYRGIAIEKNEFRYKDNDITDLERLQAFYLR